MSPRVSSVWPRRERDCTVCVSVCVWFASFSVMKNQSTCATTFTFLIETHVGGKDDMWVSLRSLWETRMGRPMLCFLAGLRLRPLIYSELC